MAIPFININSISYTSSVVTIKTNYSYLRGGGSFSVSGFPQTLYYNATSSFAVNSTATFSISLSASSVFNLTFSFYKGPYIEYPLDQPSLTGLTNGSSYILGAVPINLGFQPVTNPTILYETTRTFNYVFKT